MLQRVWGLPGGGFGRFCLPLRQRLFVLFAAGADFGFFFFNQRALCVEFRVGRLQVLFVRFRLEHGDQDFFFVVANLFLGKFNFVQKRLVLFVGFYVQRLLAVLGDLLLQRLYLRFEAAFGGVVLLDFAFFLFDLAFGAGQLGFYISYAARQGGNLVSKALDFPINLLQRLQSFQIRMHTVPQGAGLSYFSTIKQRCSIILKN